MCVIKLSESTRDWSWVNASSLFTPSVGCDVNNIPDLALLDKDIRGVILSDCDVR